MSSELKPLLDAYRAENRGEALDRDEIERRIIASLSKRRARGRRSLWIVPMGMGLLGSVALAATGGAELWRHFVGEAPRERSTATTSAPAGARSAAPSPHHEPELAQAPPVQTPPARPSDEAPEPPRRQSLEARAADEAENSVAPASARRAPPQRRASAAPHEQQPKPAHKPEQREQNPELTAYAAARRLQLEEHNPSAALRAWDSYLERFPRGPLSAEARFNRIRCLIELDQRERAIRELQPFAAGKFGRERQSQALTLLQALGELDR